MASVRACSESDCSAAAYCRGFCPKHYIRWWKHGSPETVKPNNVAGPMAPRFWAKVAVGAPDECWEWQGSRHKKGYGYVHRGGKTERAHRIAWELTFGLIPDGLIVRHVVCDNPPCCNAAHLALGSEAENTANMASRGRGWWQKRVA